MQPIVAVGYVRVSIAEQAVSGLSLAAQRRRIDAQAVVSDVDLIEILSDDGHSAATLKRPAMTEILARIDGGMVDMIIVAKLDRLTRSVKDLAMLLERLAKAKRADGAKGVDLISCAESLDTSTATGRLVINIMASVSQWEREIISERTSAALQELRAQGRSTGTPRFGFSADGNGHLFEDIEEQQILARVTELRSGGNSWQAVARTLTGQGIRTRTGGAFSRQGIRQIAKKAGIE